MLNKKNYCDCGSEIGKGSKKCRSCSLIGNKRALGNKSNLGRGPLRKEVNEKIGKKMIGQNTGPRSDWVKEKIRKGMMGKKNGLGKKLGPRHREIKEKLRKAGKRRFQKKNEREKIRQGRLNYIKNNLGPWKDTKPELKMKKILDFLNIPYEDQYRVERINHLADLHLIGTNKLIEVDGDYWHRLPGARQKDYKFNRLAKKLGYKVLRFWESDIMKNEEKVINKLRNLCL